MYNLRKKIKLPEPELDYEYIRNLAYKMAMDPKTGFYTPETEESNFKTILNLIDMNHKIVSRFWKDRDYLIERVPYEDRC